MATRKYKPLPTLTHKAEERFWSFVDQRGPDECWPWKAARTNGGYGEFGVRNGGQRKIDGSFLPLIKEPHRQYPAHRMAYFLATGDDPGSLLILHSCDNRPCCNPAHLSMGTHRENMDDMCNKRRGNHGERNAAAKITAAEAKEIREAYAAGGKKFTELAAIHGVSFGLVGLIIRGCVWPEAGGPISANNRHRGERTPASRLRAEQVVQMRSLHETQGLGSRKLSKAFGVSRNTARAVIDRTTWRHI